jgi:hypothetical protein
VEGAKLLAAIRARENFAKGLGSFFTRDLEVTKPRVLEPPLVKGLPGLFRMRDIDGPERESSIRS